MTQTLKERLFGNRITPARVAILGMLLALLIAFKYILGFVPGVEIVSFIFIFVALFLPFIDLMLLVAAFNFLVLAIYGFGSWWFAYWPIFMLDVIVSFSLRKLSKHRFFFAFLCFLGGASVGFWYFISDMIFFDKNFAMLNAITAVPINLIEGFTSLFMALLFAPALARVFQTYSHKFWNTKTVFEFKPMKHKFLTYFVSIFLALGSIAGIVTLIVYNHKFLELRQSHQGNNHLLPPNTQRDKRLITTQDYNDIYNNLNQGDNAVVLVSGTKHWTYYAKASERKGLKDYLSNNLFYVAYVQHPDKTLGAFLRQAFLTKTNKQISPDDSNGAIGTSKDWDSSPFIYVNGYTSSIGAGHLELRSKDIIEISYNGRNGKFTGRGSVSHVGSYNKNIFGHHKADKDKVWIPIVASIGTLGMIIIIIWTPNLIRRIKKRKEDTTEN